MLVMERVRMLIECEERLRRAARIRAAKSGEKNISAIIVPILEEALAQELREADAAIDKEAKKTRDQSR